MPSTSQHEYKAGCARGIALRLSSQQPGERDWQATLFFYVAVHLIEATWASAPSPFHSRDHNSRRSRLRDDLTWSHLYNEYRALENLSRRARYEGDSLLAEDLNQGWTCLRRIELHAHVLAKTASQ